ncbi:hypothetical protein HGRIS_004118 [Hohenbuehelia grisea]|uniref:Uncharacterized protein n=1 Tax=Hohenbuehelia grisea TaxID=104357 RepID=A0ABR3JIC0_9AGAR
MFLSKSSAAILPVTAFVERSRRHVYLTKPYLRVFIAAVLVFNTLFFFFCSNRLETETIHESQAVLLPINSTDADGSLPPMYERFHEYERNLPQHNESLPAPEGKNARFLWVANHAHASGWGNIMQEMIFNAHLAYASDRTYVFDNYTWNRDGPDYSDYNGNLIPSRIPVSTMLNGAIAPRGPLHLY